MIKLFEEYKKNSSEYYQEIVISRELAFRYGFISYGDASENELVSLEDDYNRIEYIIRRLLSNYTIFKKSNGVEIRDTSRSDLYLCIDICKLEDDWYIVSFTRFNINNNNYTKINHYKCDQLDGLEVCIKEILPKLKDGL